MKESKNNHHWYINDSLLIDNLDNRFFLLLQERKKTTVEEYVSSFPTEKMEAMFKAFLDPDDQMLSFVKKQEKLCCLVKNMDSDNPLRFIKDLEIQIPSLRDTADEVVHGSLDDDSIEVEENLVYSPDHLEVSDVIYKTQSQTSQSDVSNSNSEEQVQVIINCISLSIDFIMHKYNHFL